MDITQYSTTKRLVLVTLPLVLNKNLICHQQAKTLFFVAIIKASQTGSLCYVTVAKKEAGRLPLSDAPLPSCRVSLKSALSLQGNRPRLLRPPPHQSCRAHPKPPHAARLIFLLPNACGRVVRVCHAVKFHGVITLNIMQIGELR